MLLERLEANLKSRQERSLLRQLTSPNAQLVDFSSNDYLSLSDSPELKARLLDKLSSDSLPRVYGPASSRLLDGNTAGHVQLEHELAQFYGGPSALLFNSGFDANVSIFGFLVGENDVILYDELIHASTHDGMRQSRCKRRIPFKHNSVQDLSRILEELFSEHSEQGQRLRAGTADVFVAVESLYSMDGDLVPLPEVLRAVQNASSKKNCHLVVDEAHSTGLYGPSGRGLVAHYGLEDQIPIRLQTFGKAMSCGGSVVLAHPTIRDYLINYSRPLIYSTALSHMNVAAIQCAHDHMREGLADAARAHLHSLSTRFLNHLRSFLPSSGASLPQELATATLPTPIIPIITQQPRQLAKHLNNEGYLVRPICYPTVPKTSERVRICLHAANTFEQVDGLARAVQNWLRRPKL